MIQLWDFQREILTNLRHVFRNGAKSVLLVAPTGSGKTVMFCEMARNHVKRGGRVLILVHRQELTEQVSETLAEFHVEHGFIAAGFPDRLCDVNVASVFTLVKRMHALDWRPTLIIVDEAHHAVSSTTWGLILSHYAGVHILGVTATPLRLSGEGLGESFEVLVPGPSPQELIDRGYLSPFRTFCPTVPDLAGVRRRMGEFIQSELVARVDRPGITGNAIDHYAKHVQGRQAVAFCVSVEHARHVAAEFNAKRIEAQCLDGSMPRDWRRDIVRDFKARRLRVLTSCDLISEGFDCPGIEVGISLRPTQSLGLWLQQMGRCLRTSPGKAEAVLLDCAGNALRHGLPTEPRQWTLSGNQTKKADDSGPKPRVCPKCWAYMRSSARACLGCGHVFEVTPRTVPKRDGELFEVTADELAAARKKEQQKETQDFFALKTLAMNRGYKNPDAWAKRVLAQAAAKKARQMSV